MYWGWAIYLVETHHSEQKIDPPLPEAAPGDQFLFFMAAICLVVFGALATVAGRFLAIVKSPASGYLVWIGQTMVASGVVIIMKQAG